MCQVITGRWFSGFRIKMKVESAASRGESRLGRQKDSEVEVLNRLTGTVSPAAVRI